MIKKIIASFIVALSALVVQVQAVTAESFTISGNGSDSVNQTSVDTSSQQSVNQYNSADVSSTVDVTANTGGNSANNNAGDATAISTGDIDTSIAINNENINQNVANPCCTEVQLDNENKITKNGSDSENLISQQQQTQTSINSQNNASIKNNINIQASTGGNNADRNTGEQVTITTGNVTIKTVVVNKNINQSAIYIPSGSNGGVTALIDKNGTDSKNTIEIAIDERLILAQVNNASINNNIAIDASTGGNTANDNVGKVTIESGDVNIIAEFINEDINKNIIDLCPEDPADPDITPVVPPTNPPTTVEPGRGGNTSSSSSGSSSSGGIGGQVLGASTGEVLPATGGNLLLATIANVLTFLFGFYLRKRAGRSPTN